MDGVTDVERLVAFHAIMALKARYFRTVDARDWVAFANVFAPDAVLEVARPDGAIYMSLRGSTVIAQAIEDRLAGATSVHHGHNPEIDIIGPDEATGIWALEDWLSWPDRSFHGFGHYHERYVRTGGVWRIAECRLRRVTLDDAFVPPPIG